MNGRPTPEFRMPGCLRKHFHSGYKRRCRRCNEEVERQFKDVCEAYWALRAEETTP